MAALPLANLRVVDFGVFLVAPILGQILGDFGAEVVFVETTTRPDMVRKSNNAHKDQRPIVRAQMYHRNKKGVTLNLRQPDAVRIARDLVSVSDIVIENMTVGVMERMGLDYQSLRRVRPDVIMLSITPAGQTGPLADLISFGPAMNGVAGADSMVGYEDGSLVLNAIDVNVTMSAGVVFPLLAAVHHRMKTGEGQYIDTAFLEALGGVLGEGYMELRMTGRVPGPRGNTHPRYAPHGVYPCKGPSTEPGLSLPKASGRADRWVSIAAATEQEWRSLCAAMGDPAWSRDPRFADMPSRNRHYRDLDRLIGEWTCERDPYGVMHALQKAGVPATVVMDPRDLYTDPHDRFRREMTVVDPALGKPTSDDLVYGVPWTLSDTPGMIRLPSPLPGQHNAEVLGGLLGVEERELQRLATAGVVA